jgi:hypothetical protein
MVQINVGVWIFCFRGCLGTLSVHKKVLKPLSYLPGNKQIVRTSWYDRKVSKACCRCSWICCHIFVLFVLCSVFLLHHFACLQYILSIWLSVIPVYSFTNIAILHATYNFVLHANAYYRIPLFFHCWFVSMSDTSMDVAELVNH